MKTKLYLILIVITPILWGITACKSTQTTAQRLEIANEVKQKVNDLNFTFKADYAHPMSLRPIYLSPYYDVKVSTDTITAYLPYYGRAYVAPIDPSEGGIKFTSTTFEYEVRQGKKNNNWLIDIKVKDKGNDITLLFDIWDNGSVRLSVSDARRQSIAFTGKLELDDKDKAKKEAAIPFPFLLYDISELITCPLKT